MLVEQRHEEDKERDGAHCVRMSLCSEAECLPVELSCPKFSSLTPFCIAPLF